MTAPAQAMRADQAEQARLWLGAVARGEISREAAAIGQLHGARAPAQFSYLERAADADLAQAVSGEDCRVMALLDGAREVNFSKVKALDAMGADRRLLGQLTGAGDVLAARVDITRDGGRFAVGGPDGRLVLVVRDADGARADAVALSSTDPNSWAMLLGDAAMLGAWEWRAAHIGLARQLRLFPTPMAWLRGGGRGICILQWNSEAVSALRALGEGCTLQVGPGMKDRLRAVMAYGGLPLVSERAQ